MDFNLLENRIAEECPFFKSTYDVPNFWSVIIETINGEYSENTKKIIIKSSPMKVGEIGKPANVKEQIRKIMAILGCSKA